MLWNWRLSDWTQFAFDAANLRDAEARLLKGAGIVIGSMHHLAGEKRQSFVIEQISKEIVDSSAIEGEILDRISVQSSIARRLGFAADMRRSDPAEAGAAELMADLYWHYAEPLTDQLLFDWHAMLMNGRRDLADIGVYRTHADPMQIVSGPLHASRVYFEAPPTDQVPEEMSRFISWFNDSGPQGQTPMPAITRAAIAHLWFEMIHPFEDGNGRLGRALAEKALAQSMEGPTLTALAATINRHRKAYYAHLDAASQTNQIDAWLGWFAVIVLEAQEQTIESIRFLIEKTRLLDRLRGRINDRQEKALSRMMAEGPNGLVGGLSAHNYRTITDAASATATRDLAELVELGALERVGERRYARYHLTIVNRNCSDSTDGKRAVSSTAALWLRRSARSKIFLRRLLRSTDHKIEVRCRPPDRQRAPPIERKEILLNAIGEDDTPVIHPRDDLKRLTYEFANSHGRPGGDAGEGLPHKPGEGGLFRSQRNVLIGCFHDRTGPAGGTRSGGDDYAARTLLFLHLAIVNDVTRRLMAAVPDKQLIQSAEAFATIQRCLDHRASFDPDITCSYAREQSVQPIHPMPDEHPIIKIGCRIHADHRLAGQIFGDIGNKTVLTDCNDDILGCEDEPIEIGPANQGLPPVARHVRPRPRDNLPEMLMPGFELAQILPARAQIEACLFERGVTREQQLIIRLAGHEHRTGCQRRHGLLPIAAG